MEWFFFKKTNSFKSKQYCINTKRQSELLTQTLSFFNCLSRIHFIQRLFSCLNPISTERLRELWWWVQYSTIASIYAKHYIGQRKSIAVNNPSKNALKFTLACSWYFYPFCPGKERDIQEFQVLPNNSSSYLQTVMYCIVQTKVKTF